MTGPARADQRAPSWLVDAVATVAAAGGIVVLGDVVGGSPLPGEVLVVGAATGALSGLIAVGLVLVHRAQRVVSFAAVAVGAPSAAIGVSLAARGWPWAATLAATVVSAPLAALLCEVVVRRFSAQPRTVATVVTVGLAQLLVGMEMLVVANLAPDGALPSQVSTPFGGIEWQLGIARVTGDHATAAFGATLLLAAVTLVLTRTDLGLALRAVSSRPQRAAGLGLSVGRTTQAAWCIAAVLSACALVLRAPVLGSVTGGGMSAPEILLPALVAGTVAGFQDLRRAFLAAVLISCLDASVLFSTGRANAATAAVAVVALAATVAVPALRGRGNLAAAALWSAAAEPRRLPEHLARQPVARGLRWAAAVAAAVVLLGWPLVLGVGDVGRLTIAVLYGLLALSVVVATGWGGQLHLGVAGAAGAGAVVAGGLATRQTGLAGDFFVTLLVAALIGAAVTVLAGLPALRRPGVLPGVSTLALAVGVAALVRDPSIAGIAPPPGSLVGRPLLLGRWDVSTAWSFHYVCVGALVAGAASTAAFRRTRAHRLVVAARDNRRFLATTGNGPGAPVLFALALSGLLAGLAGGLLAYQQGSVDASTFAPAVSIDVLTVVVAGGVTSLGGSVVAAGMLVAAPLLFPDVPAVSALASGVGVVVVLLLLPGGAAQGIARARLALAERSARRRRADAGVPVGAPGSGCGPEAAPLRPVVELLPGTVAFEVVRPR